MHLDYRGLRINEILLNRIVFVFAIFLTQIIRFYCNRFLHLHCETEHASFVDSPRVDTNITTARFNYLFDHCEAKTDSFTVHLCRPLKLAEAGKELGHVFSSDTCSRVLHIDHK